MKIGITGGIGSGKSYVCRLLEQRGYTVYDCDSAAKRLIRSSPFIRRRLTALIGPETYFKETGDGSQETGVRSQESGDRSQESGDRSQESGAGVGDYRIEPSAGRPSGVHEGTVRPV